MNDQGGALSQLHGFKIYLDYAIFLPLRHFNPNFEFFYLFPVLHHIMSLSRFPDFLIPCCLVFLTSPSSPPWKQFPPQVVRDTVRVLRLKYKTLARAFTQKYTSKKSRLDVKNIRYWPKEPCKMSIPKISMIYIDQSPSNSALIKIVKHWSMWAPRNWSYWCVQ